MIFLVIVLNKDIALVFLKITYFQIFNIFTLRVAVRKSFIIGKLLISIYVMFFH